MVQGHGRSAHRGAADESPLGSASHLHRSQRKVYIDPDLTESAT